MENGWRFVALYLGLLFLKLCGGFPIDLDSADGPNVTVWTALTPLLATAFLVTSVVVLLGCVCCRQRKGFQEFTDSTSSHSLSGTGGYVNSVASTTEFTIFPPTHTVVTSASSSNQLSVPGDRSSVVRFDPLPDIRLPQPHSRRPAAFNSAVTHGLSSQDWFQDPHVNFPRQQLKYLRELGRGWFGRVVEGEAQNIVPEQKTSKVMVKILHEDATTTDQMYFLHEVKPYRELNHPNILKLLGRCLETDPFLILLEACPGGDLKSFLSQNIATAEALNQQGVTLQMCCNIASGLLHMHNNGFVHTDLAARNCLVTPDLLVKIGDYGTGIETFKEDYYCAGEVALPIRWCAPETLHCTDTTIETKEVTASANVWSLGVVLWEVCEFGKLPYSDLNDDEVIVKVLGEGTLRLGLPSLPCPQRQNLYLLMKLCWSCMLERPPLLQVHSMLNHLYKSQERFGQDGDSASLRSDEDFERRWDMFKPNSIPKRDDHITSPENTPIVQSSSQSPDVTSTSIHPGEDTPLQLEEDSVLKRKSLVFPQAAFESAVITQDSGNLVTEGTTITPLTTSPQPSLASSTGGEFFIASLQQRHKSPSLQNLRGSIDDLSECTVEVTDTTDWQKDDEVDHVSDAVEEKANEGSILNEESEEKEVKEIVTVEPDLDSWLEGVETANEEDAKFVRKINEAIRDLDNALALENTSSSSSEASSKCTSHQSPSRDTAAEQNVVLDFRLGRTDSGMSSDDKEMIFQPDSLQDDSYIDNVKSAHVENRATDSGTDTEDEMWRRRIERGEFSEKVKEKSRSVADLMVLTHIECSDGSDSDSPSLTWSFERSSNGRGSFTTRTRLGSFSKNISTVFSSESNIHGAVLGEEFKDTLKKLHEAQRECNKSSKSWSIIGSLPLQRFDETKCIHSEDCSEQSANPDRSKNFLVIDASEEINKVNRVVEITTDDKTPVNETVLSCPSISVHISHSDLGASTESVCDRVGRNVGVNVEKCVSCYSQVPEGNCMRSSVVTPLCQDYKTKVIGSEAINNSDHAALSGDTPPEQTVKSMNDDVPQKYVIESSLVNVQNGVCHTEVPTHVRVSHQYLFSCQPHSSSGLSLVASDGAFGDSFCRNASEDTENDFLRDEYKESGPLPLFTSNLRCPRSKVLVSDSSHPTISGVLDFGNVFQNLSPSKTLNSDTHRQSIDRSYSSSDDVSASATPSESFHFSPVNNISDGQKIVSGTEKALEVLNPSCKPLSVPSSHNAADVTVVSAMDPVPGFSLKENKQCGIMQTVVSDFIPSVVLGPCEEYTLDYFKGLKTTSGYGLAENISINPEDISQYLENNSDEKLENSDLNSKQMQLLMDYNIDLWDRHLSTAFQEHEAEPDFFNDITFTSGADTLGVGDGDYDYRPGISRIAHTPNSSCEQTLLDHGIKEMSSALENRDIFDLENSRSCESCEEELVSKTTVNKRTEGGVDSAVTPNFLKDTSDSTIDEEVFCQKCSVSFENGHGNVLNFLEDSQTSEHCDQTLKHLDHEKVDTSAVIPNVKERVDSGSEVVCDLMGDSSMSTTVHSSRRKETCENEYNIEGILEESRNVLTVHNLPLIQEKLNMSGLCIPSLNFIAATPVPSGRNTPEIVTEESIEVSNKQVVVNSIDKAEDQVLFTSKETFINGGSEQEIKILLLSQAASETAVHPTPDEKLNLENLSGEVISFSELCVDGCSIASETDPFTLIVTRPLKSMSSTEKSEVNSEVELICPDVLFSVPESHDEISEYHEIECKEHSLSEDDMCSASPGCIAKHGLEVSLSAGSQNTEATDCSNSPTSVSPRHIAECGLEVSLSTGSQNTEATVSSNSPTSGSPRHIAECGLEVSLSTGSQNTEATVSSNSPTSGSPRHIAEYGFEVPSSDSQNTEKTPTDKILTLSSSNTKVLKCEKDSLSSDPQTTIVPKFKLQEEGNNLPVTTENGSYISPKTKPSFQNAVNKGVGAIEERVLSDKQNRPLSSDLFTVEIGEGNELSSLNHFSSEEANIIPENLKHSQSPNVDSSLFKWSAEENSNCKPEREDLKHIQYPDTVSDVHELDLKENSVLEGSCFMQAGTETPGIAGHISKPDTEQCNEKFYLNLTDSLGTVETTHTKFLNSGEDIFSVKETNSKHDCSETSNYKYIPVQPIEINHPDFETDVLKLCVKETKETYVPHGISYGQVSMRPIEINAPSPDFTATVEKINEDSKFLDYEQVPLELVEEKQFEIDNHGQVSAETKELCDLDLRYCEQASKEVVDLIHTLPSDGFSEKEADRVVVAVDLWKQNQSDSSIRILIDDFLLEERLACGLPEAGLDVKREESSAGEEEDYGEGFGLDVVKHSTPDDERSSDSGFRDKGSLSESCEEACDEKYNLEDIEAELEDTFNKGGFNYVEKHGDEVLGDQALEEQQRKLSDSSFNYIEGPEDEDLKENRGTALPIRSSDEIAHSVEDLEYLDNVHKENSNDKPVEGKQIMDVDTLENAESDQGKTRSFGDFIEFEVKDQLKPEYCESCGSDFMKQVPELIRTEFNVNNHHDASKIFQQHELVTLTDDFLNAVLPVKSESSTMNNCMSVNQINEFLGSNREPQNAELLNCETISGQQQILTDSNVMEQFSVDDHQSRYPVTIPTSEANIISLADSIPGKNLKTEILIADKIFTKCENKHGEILSSISPSDKMESTMDGPCLISTQNSGFDTIGTFSFDEAYINGDMFMAGSKPELGSRDLPHSELMQNYPESAPAVGWYLHPPPKRTNCERDLENTEECTSSVHSGSCSSKYEESNNSENSYVSFSLDEEFVTAIRNELRDKLPCTRQRSEEEEEEEEEEELEEEEEVSDPEDDLPQEERTNIIIHYNMYPAQLSPILEERESLSSVTTTISDHYSPLASSNQLDASKSGSGIESLSPVFVLDPRDVNSRAQYEVNARKFEQEIREALENCSLTSEDTSSSCEEVRKESSVLFEDLEQQTSKDPQRLSLDRKNIVVVQGTNQHPDDDDDLLLINTETNEATLLESPKPKSHLAFVNNRRTPQENKSVHALSGTANILSDDEIIVGSNSDTFVIDRSRFSDFDVDSKLGPGRELSDDEVYTPDSISPEHATGTPSASTLQSPDTENLSDFFLTPSEKSCNASECPNSVHGSQNSTVYNPYFLHALSKDNDNPTFEEVQEISLGVANNEAAEIILELESSGIFNNNNNCTNEKSIFTGVLPLCEEVAVHGLPSSRTSDINDNCEVSSVQDNSESSEMSRKDFSDDSSDPKKMSPVDRLNYLTSPNLDVFCAKTKESAEEECSENGNNCNSRLLLTKTLDLLKRHKESQQNNNDPYQEDEEKDWSLPNLEASVFSTKAPMPSPEEESWKQIPSLLAFSDLNEVITRCSNKQETFDTVSFNGPTNYMSFSDHKGVDDGDLMSTSFSIRGDPGDPESYTPDWESGSDETNEDDNNSSSSGEFIWKEGDRESSLKAVDMSSASSTSKPYEGLSDFPMEVIAEEEEDDEDDDDDDADGSSSSGSGTEFVPSAWNSEATPNRSALRSPDKKSDQKKNVSFKKQKYHSVYEYPRETSDSDSEGFDSPTRVHWNSLMLQSAQQRQVDYSSFADWELLDGDILPEGSVPDTDVDPDIPEDTTQQQLDFYKLSSVDYDFTNGMVSEDGEFYISSSARPFQFPGGTSDMLTSNGSQFFPGQLYLMGSECKQGDITVDFVTPDSGIIDITAPDKLSALETGVDSYNDEVDTSASSISGFAVSFDNQLASYKSDSMKKIVWEDEVDCVKPGADEMAGKWSALSLDVGQKISLECEKVQKLPFADFLELGRASDHSSNTVLNASVTNEMSSGARSVPNSVVADRDSETAVQSPPSPPSPSGLGELRHTRDRLKLDLPLSSTAFVLDPPVAGKRRSVETVKGEASLLDSGEETEDSGIESSNGVVTSLTREVRSHTEDPSKT